MFKVPCPVADRVRDVARRAKQDLGQREYEPGLRGQITFRSGGPAGGYWEFKPEK